MSWPSQSRDIIVVRQVRRTCRYKPNLSRSYSDSSIRLLRAGGNGDGHGRKSGLTQVDILFSEHNRLHANLTMAKGKRGSLCKLIIHKAEDLSCARQQRTFGAFLEDSIDGEESHYSRDGLRAEFVRMLYEVTDKKQCSSPGDLRLKQGRPNYHHDVGRCLRKQNANLTLSPILLFESRSPVVELWWAGPTATSDISSPGSSLPSRQHTHTDRHPS